MPFEYDKPLTKETYAMVRKYYDLFTSPTGKEVLSDMIEIYEIRSSVIRGDPYGTHFLEGQRSVVLEIKRILNGVEKNLFIKEKEEGE